MSVARELQSRSLLPKPVHHKPDRILRYDEQGYGPYDIGDGFGERAVAVLHGVHLNPGNATPARRALPGHLERDTRDRVLGDDHRTPFLDPASGPDPHRVAGVDGCWLIDRTPSPIVDRKSTRLNSSHT